MSYKEFIENIEKRLNGIYGSREGRAIAVRLLQHYCGISSYEHIINPNGEISHENMVALIKATEELVTARPIQYVFGFAEFHGRNFLVEEGVLIPRPETEELVRWVLEDFRGDKLKNPDNIDKLFNATERQITHSVSTQVLDAACGSGCIGITLACEISNSQVFALDFSDKAIEVTKANAKALLEGKELVNACEQEFIENKDSCRNSFWPFKCDLLAQSSVQNVIEKNSLDIIVSNPPYVKESERLQMRRNVLNFEPAEALFVPDNNPMLFYRALCEWGVELLKPSGLIYLEINEAHSAMVVKLLKSNGFTDVTIRKDLSGKDRMVRGSISR